MGDVTAVPDFAAVAVARDRLDDLGFAIVAAKNLRTPVRRHAHQRDTADRTRFCGQARFVHCKSLASGSPESIDARDCLLAGSHLAAVIDGQST